MKGLLASAKLSYDFSEKAEFIAASTAYLDGIKPVRENGRLVCATVLQHTLKICQDRLGTTIAKQLETERPFTAGGTGGTLGQRLVCYDQTTRRRSNGRCETTKPFSSLFFPFPFPFRFLFFQPFCFQLSFCLSQACLGKSSLKTSLHMTTQQSNNYVLSKTEQQLSKALFLFNSVQGVRAATEGEMRASRLTRRRWAP